MSENYPEHTYNLLLADDDDAYRTRLARSLQSRGFTVISASGVQEANRIISQQQINFAVVDLRMQDGTGLEVLKKIQDVQPHVRSIMLTGYGSIANTVDAMHLGAVGYLAKPVNADMIMSALFRDPNADPAEVNDDKMKSQSLAQMEWEHIQRVLSECDGNISEASRRLKIHRRSLQRKLQKYPPGN